MNTKELRQAAILLHDWECVHGEEIEWNRAKGHPWHRSGAMDQAEKTLLLSRHILATVQEDGEEPVTEDWLRGEWGFKDELGDMVLAVPKWEAIYWVPELSRIEFGMTWARVTTRSQFRSLMTGLNIEPLSKLVKPLDEVSK